MIETVTAPTFSPDDFSRRDKKPGISCIVRLKNEAEFGAMALESALPYCDEMIVVYSPGKDRTLEVITDFAARHPAQVRAYNYQPAIVPLGSSRHLDSPPDSPHSFVHLTNFALSKASYMVRFIWDGDHVAVSDRFGPIVQRLRSLVPGTPDWYLSPWCFGYWWYTGLNLWSVNEQLYVPASHPYAGKYGENSFFPAGRWLVYKKYPRGEYLFRRFLRHRNLGILFYHLKGMKHDRGVTKYELAANPDSLFHKYAQSWQDTQFWTLDEFRARTPGASGLPDPATLGIYSLSRTRVDALPA
jgi:glycosyltransferase involved in cell wall biosynthesis